MPNLELCSSLKRASAVRMLTLCQAEPNSPLLFRFSSLSSLTRMYFICIAYALLKSFLDPFSSKRLKNLKNTVADAKGKGKHSISFAYALLTHFTVVAASHVALNALRQSRTESMLCICFIISCKCTIVRQIQIVDLGLKCFFRIYKELSWGRKNKSPN